jgi:hypothetical protein
LNCKSTSRLQYKKGRLTPFHASPSDQDSCHKAHCFLLVREVGPRQNHPPRPLPCLLLKPISANHANCPICSPYRPTRASVLSGHIDSVSVAAIICHAPQLSLLRVTLPGLPSTARPTVSRRSYGSHNPSQASYDRFSLLLTKVERLSSLLRTSCCACSPVPALPVVQTLLCL